jgi:hypothetical protein
MFPGYVNEHEDEILDYEEPDENQGAEAQNEAADAADQAANAANLAGNLAEGAGPSDPRQAEDDYEADVPQFPSYQEQLSKLDLESLHYVLALDRDAQGARQFAAYVSNRVQRMGRTIRQ